MSSPALEAIIERERKAYSAARPRSAALALAAARHFVQGVPMHWMRDWSTPFALTVANAHGAVLVDVDGHQYVDFCLGDTGAMYGHSPAVVAEAIAWQVQSGLTMMLPTSVVADVGEQLATVFGLPWWQVTQTATDANRAVLRHARAISGRKRVLVFDRCYHGTVDETLVEMAVDGTVLPRPGQIGRVHDPRSTTAVVDFNDIPALERVLATGEIACVLTEPVMTNAGMVLPEQGFLQALRASCTRHDVLLVIDETHTLSTGFGGYAWIHGVAADFLVCGKAIAGGFPCAVFGYTDAVATHISAAAAKTEPGHSGIGTTLAANALAMAALHANLSQIMTPANHALMNARAAQMATGMEQALSSRALPWQVSRVGARLEFGRKPAPRTGRESMALIDHELQSAMHLYFLNRGFLLTPFHNMLLCSPATTEQQVAAFLSIFEQALTDFLVLMRAS